MHAFGNHAGHGVTIHHMFTHIMIYIHIHEYTYIYCFSYLDVLKPHFSIIHAYTYIYICIHTYTYKYIHILTSSWAGRPGNSLMTGCLPIFLQIKGVGRDHTLTPIASDIRVRLQSSSSRSCTHSALRLTGSRSHPGRRAVGQLAASGSDSEVTVAWTSPARA
jgi:hypothetical protein